MRILIKNTSSLYINIESSLLQLVNKSGSEFNLGYLSYILNRTDKYSNLNIDAKYLHGKIFDIIDNLIFNDEELYPLFTISTLSSLRELNKNSLKENLFKELNVLLNNKKVNDYKPGSCIYIINGLDVEKQNAIKTVYYCAKNHLISDSDNSKFNMEDYLRLIDLSILLKYSLLLTSCFPQLSNNELYVEFYREFIQSNFQDIVSKISHLIKENITIMNLDDEIYYNFSTMIEVELFLDVVMYYDIYDISPNNNLLNLINKRIAIKLFDIKNNWIIKHL